MEFQSGLNPPSPSQAYRAAFSSHMSCTSIPIGTLYSTPAVVETIIETTITVYTSPGTTITVPYTTTECSSISPSVTSDPITSDPITSDPVTSATTSSRVTTSDEPVITDPPTTEGGRSSEAVTTSDEVRTTDAPATSDGPETADDPITTDSGANADDGANADGGTSEDGGNNSAEPTDGAARRRRHRYPRQLQCTTFVTSSISTVDSQLITSPLVIQGLTTRFGDPVAVGTEYSVTCAPEPGQTVTAVVTVTPEVTTPEPEPTTVTHVEPTVTVMATVISVSNLVSTLLVPSTLWPTSSSIANSTQTTPATTPGRSSNVGMIAGAIAAAVVVLAVVLGVAFYFKCFRKKSDERGSHIVDLGAPPAGGLGLSSAALMPDRARVLHPFTLGGGGTPYLTADGGRAGSSSSAGERNAFVLQEKGAITAAHNAAPVIVAGDAKRRGSDSSQPILPTLLKNPSQQHPLRNTDPLVSSSSSQRQSSVEGTTSTDPTYTLPTSSEKASVYVDPRMSGMPLLAGTPSNEGSSHRDSVTSYLLSSPGLSSPGHKRGRPLPSIPGKTSSSSPPPDPSTAISPLDRASTLGRTSHRPFSPESRPRSPEQPPPSYDETERIHRRESTVSTANNNRPQ